jgi:hypothetical protein
VDYGLQFVGTGGDGLVGYSDADWAGDVVGRRSTSGYAFQLLGGTISWASTRQSVVAKSTTEAEYMALSQATSEAVWLRRLLTDLGFPQKSATVVYADNMSAMALARNPQFHKRTKHIDVHFHYVRECIASDVVVLEHVSSGDMIADTLTKGLARPKFRYFRSKLGVEYVS